MAINAQNIPMYRNGQQAIAFMGRNDVSRYFQGYVDNASLNTWLEEDPMENYRGMVSFFNQQTKGKPASFLDDLIDTRSVIELNGWDGSFTYDVPVETKTGLYIEEDMSHQNYAGIEEGTFYMVLNKDLAAGTVITYDDDNGIQAIVADDEEVEPTGTGYKTPFKLVSNDRQAWFPAQYLAKGTEYFIVSQGTGEYGTKFAKVQMPETPASMRFEFRLGSIMGTESYITGMADSKSFDNGRVSTFTKDYLNELQREMDSNKLGEIAVRFDLGADGKPNVRTANFGRTLEFLTMKQLHKMMGTKLMFQNAAQIKTTNGVVNLNEGLWKQAKRGRTITYSRKITRMHIAAAVDYVFRASDLTPEMREVEFECGTEAYYQVLDLFQAEVQAQLGVNAQILGLGFANQLPKGIVEGSDLKELRLNVLRFTSVYLPGIGNVKIKLNQALDWGLRADRMAKGMHRGGRAHTTGTMMIWDASSSTSSNNRQGVPQGASLVEGGNEGANVYLVKPKGAMVYSGTRHGRYDSTRNSGIVSSGNYIGEEYFAYSIVDIWLSDPSKVVMIEKERTDTGFH